MPTSAPHPCARPGCPRTTHERFCEAHKARGLARAQDTRLSSAKRGYGYEWQTRTRPYILRRDPICVNPFNLPDHIVPSECVDHKIPREAGGTDAEDNLQGMCLACHARKTAAEDGGFGNPRAGSHEGG